MSARRIRMNVGGWIAKWALLRPEKTAMIYEETSFSYRALNRRINRLARFLLRLGVEKGDRVALLLYNCNQYLEAFFALSKIGAILVPLNYRLVAKELEFILNDSGARTIIFEPALVELVTAIKGRVSVNEGRFICIGDGVPDWAIGYESGLAGELDDEPEMSEPAGDEDIHIIMYTSGTTGFPKGAMLSHRKTFFNVLNADIFYELTQHDILLVTRPLIHSGGLLVESVPMLYKGGTIIMKRHFRAGDIMEAIEKYRVTVLEASSTMFKFILEQTDMKQYDLSSLKCCFTGGERVAQSLLKEYYERGMVISQIYGQTETSTITWLPLVNAVSKLGSSGIPVFHGEVGIVDKEGRQVKAGEVGEIVVSGDIMMTGYWGRPELTKETIVDGRLHTGDLARMDEEGFFYIVDREKDMYISGGENVYPAEIEKVYLENTRIENVAVVGIPDDKWGEVGIAFVVLKEDEQMTEEEAIGFCDGRLARYKIPKKVLFVRNLPMTVTQKIMRNRLKQDYLEGCQTEQ
jgi:fatty-acyl-CoA synthase